MTGKKALHTIFWWIMNIDFERFISVWTPGRVSTRMADSV
jgi:hypothetical protein